MAAVVSASRLVLPFRRSVVHRLVSVGNIPLIGSMASVDSDTRVKKAAFWSLARERTIDGMATSCTRRPETFDIVAANAGERPHLPIRLLPAFILCGMMDFKCNHKKSLSVVLESTTVLFLHRPNRQAPTGLLQTTRFT
jgi:hypothetical protein